MATFTTTPVFKIQWMKLRRKENKFLEKQYDVGLSAINDAIEDKIPDKLQSTLDAAFNKAFALVFEKGTDIIEKTYNKSKHQTRYQTNQYADELMSNKQTGTAFAKHADSTKKKNLLISGVEGIGLGILGIGLPDIPLFTSVILKSIYEIALSYGFSYDTEQEQIFILKIIKTALSHGDELYSGDKELNRWIAVPGNQFTIRKDEQIRITSDSMSMEMIYMKFIQTLPIAGAFGGAYDVVYLHRITKYADLKYQRRFLMTKFTPKKI